MTLVSSTNDLFRRRSPGSLITRGSTRGTLTIEIVLRRPKASLPPRRAMKLSDLFATCGNGCAGSSPTGTSSGRTCVSKKRSTQRRSASLRSAWLTIRMPLAASAGITSSLKTVYCVVDQGVRRGRERLDVGGGDAGVGAARGLEVVGEADLEELVEVRRDDADVAQPLEQRHVVAARLREHPAVELEDRGFAVQQGGHAAVGLASRGLGHPPSL